MSRRARDPLTQEPPDAAWRRLFAASTREQKSSPRRGAAALKPAQEATRFGQRLDSRLYVYSPSSSRRDVAPVDHGLRGRIAASSRAPMLVCSTRAVQKVRECIPNSGPAGIKRLRPRERNLLNPLEGCEVHDRWMSPAPWPGWWWRAKGAAGRVAQRFGRTVMPTTGGLSVTAPALSVARAVSSWFPGGTFLHVNE
jgi:hypothetical protein